MITLRIWSAGRMLLAAALLLALLMGLHLSRMKGAAGGRMLPDDASYASLAVARTLSSGGGYAVAPGEPAPATADTLWRVVLAACTWLCDTAETTPYLAGLLFALALLLATYRMARSLPDTAGAGLALLLLAGVSSLSLDAVDGRSGMLASALVAWMLLIHVRHLDPQERPLSLSLALVAGLAATVRIELLSIWIVLAIHAVVTGALHRKGIGRGFVMPLIRSASGALLIACVLMPLLAHNMRLLGVPYPRSLEAPIGGSFGFALVIESYARAFSVPLLGGLGLLLLIAACGFVLSDTLRDRARYPWTALTALLLVPAVFAGFQPALGWAGADIVFNALQPAWAVLMGMVLVRGGSWLSAFAQQKLQREHPALRAPVLIIALSALVILLGLPRIAAEQRTLARQVKQASTARTELDAWLPASTNGLRVATDHPGWVAYRHRLPVADLSGGLSPVMLAFQRADGWDGAGAAAYLRQLGVTHLAVRDPALAYAAGSLGCQAAQADAWSFCTISPAPAAAP